MTFFSDDRARRRYRYTYNLHQTEEIRRKDQCLARFYLDVQRPRFYWQ